MTTAPSSTIAVTGAAGQLGRELCRLLGPRGTGLPRAALDISQPQQVQAVLERLRPAAVINCAAWTAVDRAETEFPAALEANAIAVQHLADACRTIGCRLVQVSTDYVFGADASRTTPYAETDPPGPLNGYGRSKLAGEEAARSWVNHQIVRTCGLYAAGEQGPVRGRNFADTMLVLARDRPEVRVVADQFCTPSYVPHVAEAILALLESDATGTFHLTNAGSTSWHGFARELFQQAGLPTGAVPIAASEYPSPVVRPAYSVLDAGRLGGLGIFLPSWQKGIAAYLAAQTGGGQGSA